MLSAVCVRSLVSISLRPIYVIGRVDSKNGAAVGPIMVKSLIIATALARIAPTASTTTFRLTSDASQALRSVRGSGWDFFWRYMRAIAYADQPTSTGLDESANRAYGL